MLREDAILSAVARILVKKKAKSIEDLTALYQTPGGCTSCSLS